MYLKTEDHLNSFQITVSDSLPMRFTSCLMSWKKVIGWYFHLKENTPIRFGVSWSYFVVNH